MNALVTGASGLLGSHVLKAGLDRGVALRATSRSVPRRSYLQESAGQIAHVTADLAAEVPEDLLDSVETVIHCAGLASSLSGDEQKLRTVNVDAARRLFEKAEAAEVATWVQISSVAAIAGGADGGVINELWQGGCRPTAYGRSKWEVDRWMEGRSSRMRVLFIHPCYMLGPWDSKPSSGAIFYALRLKRVRHFVDGVKNFVAAADVADGIWQAIAAGSAGHYLLGNANVRISEFLATTCDLMGMDFSSLVEMPATVLETGLMPQGDEAKLSEAELSFMQEFCISGAVSWEKAARDFGYAPRVGLQEMIRLALQYLMLLRPTQ
jgi:dihydroflavonol-4-reductase